MFAKNDYQIHHSWPRKFINSIDKLEWTEKMLEILIKVYMTFYGLSNFHEKR